MIGGGGGGGILKRKPCVGTGAELWAWMGQGTITRVRLNSLTIETDRSFWERVSERSSWAPSFLCLSWIVRRTTNGIACAVVRP
jgi:hypothetical protein